MSTPIFKANIRARLATMLLLAASAAFADVGPPLYVANGGIDAGDCNDGAAPCATIAYALRVAGKNAQIRVAPGTYRIDDPADAIYLLSGALTVTGGYIADASITPMAGGPSIITGLPLEYRELLRDRGFHLITDQKGNEAQDAAARQTLVQYQKTQISQPATECLGGSAGPYACNGVDLLSFVSRLDIDSGQDQIADIWGFVDLNTDREYAIVGGWFGTGVFDVTDPENPQEIGFIDGMPANWRDIKVYQYFDTTADRYRAFAYVTTDGAGDGLFVIDLGGLPHRINRVTYGSDFTNAHNVYITNLDYSTGLRLDPSAPQLIVAGAGGTGDSNNRGQFRTYDLSNPAAPQFVQRVASAGYMHDTTSLKISDARTAQCANPGADCEVIVDFNEENVEVWDVTNAASPSLLSRVSQYPNTGYVHSGWWSEDRQFVFVHDELDERNPNPVTQTTLRVFSIANLTNPQQVGTWTGPTGAIDHNGFVRGNRYYMSNYTRGMTILDITDPTNPADIAYFDTYTTNDNTGFAGAWGAYPFFHSGTVAVSDINNGMFLLRDRTLDVTQGSLTFAADSYAASEGTQAALTVSRLGGSSGAVSVRYEVLGATADDDDIVAQTGTLNWASGDNSDRTIAIDVVNGDAAESLERLFVRLVDPTGFATLGTTNTASLYIVDENASAIADIALFADQISTTERGFGKAIIVVQRNETASGAASVDFAVTAGDAVLNTDFTGSANGTLTWADGDAGPQSIEYTIVDDGSGESDEFFEVTLSNPQGSTINGVQSVRIDIEDGLGSNTAPNAIAGASQTLVEGSIVTLDGSASNDPDGDALSFAWSQVSGPQVTLSGAATATATFTAPMVSSDSMLQFQLQVTDPRGLNDVASTNVTVTNSGGGGSVIGGGGGTPAPITLLLLVALSWWRSSRTGSA